jgi:tripartite-type tricarboxylate transporter receptor subunit TctC
MEVNPNVPAKTVAEFIAFAKANPGKVNMASSGVGTSVHLSGALFMLMTGVEMVHVPYRGGGPAVADVIAGHVPAIFLPVTTLAEQLRSGALVALAITSRTRAPVLPQVPTFAESGYPDLVLASWFGLSGPKNLDADVIVRINREARAFLKEPTMRKLAENDASEPLDADAAGFARYVAAEVARWGEVVRVLDIKAEE